MPVLTLRDMLKAQTELKGRMKALHDEAGEGVLNADAQVDWGKMEGELVELESRITRQAKIDEWDKMADDAAAPDVKPDGDDFDLQCRSFSLQKLIAYQLGAKGVDWGKELELSAELQKRSDRTFRGMPAPMRALSRRAVSDYTTTKPSAGAVSNLIAPDFRPEMYVDLLRNASVLSRLPVTSITGLKGTITYPRAKSGVTGAWVAEDAIAAHETMTWEQSTLGPMKWASTICQFGRQAMLSTAIGIEGLIRDDFAKALARLVDAAFLSNNAGTGTQPSGILYTGNSVNLSATVTDTNGLDMSWGNWRAMKLLPELKNIDGPGMFVTSPRAKDYYEQKLKDTTGNNGYVIENDMVAGKGIVTSNALPDTGTKGSGSNLSTVLYGLWDHFLYATADELDIMTNPYATDAFDRGAVQVRAMMAMDWAVRHEDAFIVFANAISR